MKSLILAPLLLAALATFSITVQTGSGTLAPQFTDVPLGNNEADNSPSSGMVPNSAEVAAVNTTATTVAITAPDRPFTTADPARPTSTNTTSLRTTSPDAVSSDTASSGITSMGTPFMGTLAATSPSAPPLGEVLVPESAGIGANDGSVRSHTRLRVLVVPDATSATTSHYNTPAMIHSVYNLPSSGGSGAIAIVDAYHYPTSLADFNAFAKNFGLPQETSTNSLASTNKVFQVVYASGAKPQSGGNYIASWNLEEALDIEWAHAMAPNAKIYLVEANSDGTSDLDTGVRVAGALTGVKEISMSWGGSEVSYEASTFDPIFTKSGIVYFASGGDSSDEMEYPAASPNVVSCGGTSINRSSSGVFTTETGWNDTGCGPSVYEPRPTYQNAIAAIVGSKRGVSDISFVADPNTGVYVYDTTSLWGETGWWILGGTSVASPSLAGVVNLAATAGNGFAASTAVEQARIYSHLGNSGVFRDITSGTDGTLQCKVGWDYVTGVGTPLGVVGK
jgi:kumamolisin